MAMGVAAVETIMEINREIKEPIANGRVKNGTRYIGGGAINSFQRLKENLGPDCMERVGYCCFVP